MNRCLIKSNSLNNPYSTANLQWTILNLHVRSVRCKPTAESENSGQTRHTRIRAYYDWIWWRQILCESHTIRSKAEDYWSLYFVYVPVYLRTFVLSYTSISRVRDQNIGYYYCYWICGRIPYAILSTTYSVTTYRFLVRLGSINVMGNKYPRIPSYCLRSYAHRTVKMLFHLRIPWWCNTPAQIASIGSFIDQSSWPFLFILIEIGTIRTRVPRRHSWSHRKT